MKRFAIAGAVLGLAVVPGVTATASGGATDPNSIQLSTGYVDTLRAGGNLPSGWGQSAVFVGNVGPYDAGALLINNPSNNPLDVDDVSVNVGGTVTDLWGSFVVPPKSSAILTQTASYNFDTSDENSQHCRADGVIPTITVTVAQPPQHPFVFADTSQVLNTGGIDQDTCTTQPNESHDWVRAANISDSAG